MCIHKPKPSKNMKIQINTEAELDLDVIADALDSTIDCKIDGFLSELDLSDEVACAMSEIDLSDEITSIVSDRSFDYEIDSALDDFDFSKVDEIDQLDTRVTDLEDIIDRLSQALPNGALEEQLEANKELQNRYDDLETKFRKMAGLDDVSDIEKDQI